MQSSKIGEGICGLRLRIAAAVSGGENGVSRYDGKRFENFAVNDGLVNCDVNASL